MRFRKSIRIGKGLTLNGSAKGIRGTASIPGTGISDSTMLHKSTNQRRQSVIAGDREVSLFLFIGILFIPYIFSWFTLRKGYSNLSRILSFAWLFYLFYLTIR